MADQDPLKKLYGKTFSAGHVIFREGERGNKFFLIQSGKVRIVKSLGGADEVELTEFGAGDFFGEMALFDMETRSATAICDGDTEVYELGQRNFESFVMQKPRVAMDIIQKLCKRIRHTNEMATQARVDAKSGGSENFFDLAVSLLIILASESGKSDGSAVIVRPRLDVSRLSEIYGCDASGLLSFFSQAARTKGAAEFLTQFPHVPDDLSDLVHTLIERTVVELDLDS